eukprot:11213589-Lingulodinium_polyedra.AAC.1
MTELSVVDLVKVRSKFGGSVVGHAQMQHMERLVESFKQLLAQQADRFVESAGSRPIRLSFSNDGVQ